MDFIVDSDKVQTYFLHVLKSAKKFQEKQVARSELVQQLKELRKLKIDKNVKNHLDKLESSIKEAINAEKRILKAQSAEDMFHSDLKSKITQLDSKIDRYIQATNERDKRVEIIEKKIEDRMKKKDQLAELQGQLEGLEVMYYKLKRRNIQAPELLDKIASKISDLKSRIRSS